MSKTKVYEADEIKSKLIEETINDVAKSLSERGYNPINQIVGYLMSGDPGYISNHNDARNKITQYERTNLLEVLVAEFLKK